MSEKRFSLKEWEDLNYCEHCFYDGESQLSDDDVVVLLNEQQATNDYLEESNSRLQVQLGETLRLVDEQQATIEQLQDLCGQSDGENAKLRIENKRLEKEVNLLRPTNLEQYEQIQKLQEENEQLKERRDYWSKKTKEFIYYFNCLEKAIEKTFDSDNQYFEEIWKHYDGMEKKWEYNDSFVGNWTDKPVLLERKMVNINENRDKQRLLAKQGKGISRRE